MRKWFETILLFLLMAGSLLAIHFYITFYTPASREGGIRVIYIQKGMSFRVVAANLEKAGVVRDSDSLILAANLLGAYKKIKAGEYEFNRAMTPMEVLEILIKGRVKRHLITIPEGYNIKDVAAVLKEAGLATERDFIEKATDKRFVASLGMEGATLEGYLFPDTYEFTRGMGTDEIITRMVEKFKSIYFPEFNDLARKKGLTMKKVLTIASIIEKETGSADERELISAVFHNRLKKGIKLQSDPTVIYDIQGFDGNLTKKHLLTRTPYNTYVVYGLPPGPIANPGKASIRAALYPADEEYLYFVSRNDGTHFFSRNLKDHNKAVIQYQKSITVKNQKQEG
ncbi:MAG: endolytic transglycosylase MltG [Deltaproteobacteria bacterium]|nr:endolytic transglycosylase MltG [Deltaproteobacteria bacterium]